MGASPLELRHGWRWVEILVATTHLRVANAGEVLDRCEPMTRSLIRETEVMAGRA